MKSFKLNESGDLSIINNDIITIKDDEELMQQIRIVLNINAGEWFLNSELGFDYKTIMTKQFDYRDIELAIEEAILINVEEIEQVVVNSIELDKENRSVRIDVSVVKEDGEELNMMEVFGYEL